MFPTNYKCRHYHLKISTDFLLSFALEYLHTNLHEYSRRWSAWNIGISFDNRRNKRNCGRQAKAFRPMMVCEPTGLLVHEADTGLRSRQAGADCGLLLPTGGVWNTDLIGSGVVFFSEAGEL